jgi:hypothetical protein
MQELANLGFLSCEREPFFIVKYSLQKRKRRADAVSKNSETSRITKDLIWKEVMFYNCILKIL